MTQKKDEFEKYDGMLKNESEFEEELDEARKDREEVVKEHFTDPEEEIECEEPEEENSEE